MGNFLKFLSEEKNNGAFDDTVHKKSGKIKGKAGIKDEKLTADGIRDAAQKQEKDITVSYTNTGIRGKEVNFKSDILLNVKLKNQKKSESGYVEVKASDNAQMAHWNCMYDNGKIFVDFDSVKKSNDIEDTDNEFAEIVSEVLSKETEEQLKTAFENIKEEFNINVEEVKKIFDENKNKTSNQFNFGYDEKDLNKLKITEFKFPKSLNRLEILFNIYDNLHRTNYKTYRDELNKLISDMGLSDVENKDIIDLKEMLNEEIDSFSEEKFKSLINSIDTISKVFKQYSISDNLISDFNTVSNNMKRTCNKYIILLSEINKLRKTHKESTRKKEDVDFSKITTLGGENGLKDYEKKYYTLKRFVTYKPKDNTFKPWSKGIIIANDSIDNNSTVFQKILKKITKYYHEYMKADYIQVGDELMKLTDDESNKDVLGIDSQLNQYGDKNVENIEYVFQFDNQAIKDKNYESNIGLTFYVVIHLKEDKNAKSFKGKSNNFPEIGDKVKHKKVKTKKVKAEVNDSDEKNINESISEGVKTSDSESYKFEVEVADKIKEWKNTIPRYKSLEVKKYSESDNKYFSDIYIYNPSSDKRIWVEVKENKYGNLGSASFKYKDGEWTCTTLDDDNPLIEVYLEALKENSNAFIDFCKSYLKKDDISLPKDLTVDLVEAWKKSGNIDDTDNETQFITNKIPLDEFGFKIAEYYKYSKDEPVYYLQSADDLYIIDPNYNVLGLKCKDGSDLKPLSEAYRIGRIQFRLKGQEKIVNGKKKYYYSIFQDVKILADKENADTEYSCSFANEFKWPIVED